MLRHALRCCVNQIAILAFAWKCDCAKGAHFTQEEFVRGMSALR